MSNRIISLCCVSNRNDKTTELCRVADYEGGRFTPYIYDPRQSFYENERDLIYGPSPFIRAEVGSYGVFEWNAIYTGEGQWWTEVDRRDDISWVEVVVVDVNSVSSLIRAMKYGISLPGSYDGRHDLILCTNTYASEDDSILLSPQEVVYRDSKLFFSDEITSVRAGKTNKELTSRGKCRYASLNMKRFATSTAAFKLQNRYIVKTTAEVVNDVLRGNINRLLGDAFSRKDKKVIREALSKFTDVSLVDTLMKKLNCSREDAEKHIRDYIESAEIKLDDEAAMSYIELLIDNDVAAVQKLKEEVKDQWQQEHEQELLQARHEIEKIQSDLENVEKEILQKQSMLEQIREEEYRSIENAKEAEKLYQSMQEKIRDYMSHIQDDMAGALVNYALINNQTPKMQQSISPQSQEHQNGFVIPVQELENVEKGDLQNALLAAPGYWHQMAGRTRWTECLSLLSAAAFAAKQPVVITGEGADAVADMMTTNIYGHKPLRVVMSNSDGFVDMVHAIEENNHDIICVSNGLGESYTAVRKFMDLFPESRFILTEKHEEALALEPDSFFYTFLPIRSDYFYNGNIPDEYSNMDCTDELFSADYTVIPSRNLKEARAKTEKWFGTGYYPPIIRNRFARMQYLMARLDQKVHGNAKMAKLAEVEFLGVQWINSLHSAENVEQVIRNFDWDQDVKDEILAYLNSGSM